MGKILTYLFCFLLCIHLNAQQHQVRFNHIGLKEGLSQTVVNCLIKSSEGYLWIGTQDGLNRYDGTKFTIFKNDPTDSLSLNNNYIRTLFEDSKQRVWIGTDRGVSYFNPSTQNFKQIIPFGHQKNSKITQIIQHGESLYCIGDKHLYEINLNTLAIDIPSFRTEITGTLSSIASIHDNNLLIGTENKGLFHINLNTNTVLNHNSRNSSLKNNTIHCILQEDKHKVYIGTNNGISLYNPQSEYFRSSQLFDKHLNNKSIEAICIDQENNIWIGTSHHGVYRQINHNDIEHFGYDFNYNHSISNNRIKCIYEDNTGLLWVGTYNGIDKYNATEQFFNHFKHNPNIPNSLSSNRVYSILIDSEQHLWVGTDLGIDVFSDNKKLHHYELNDQDLKLTRNKTIYALFEDSYGTIYIGTDAGLFYVNEGRIQQVIFQKNPNPITQRVYKIFEDRTKRLWIGTKDGLAMINKSRTDKTAFNAFIQNSMVRDIVQTPDNIIWVATQGNGLCEITENKERFSFHFFKRDRNTTSTFSNNNLLTLYPDDDGYIWAGTFSGGLNRFNRRTKETVTFDEKDGLSNNVIYGILEDERQQLWMTTNKGVTRFNRVSFKTAIYNIDDGLQSDEFNVGAYYKAKNGELFFGGINGFNRFFPNKIIKNRQKPQIIFENLYLSNKKVPIHKEGILPKHISKIDELNLTYKQNILSFSFTALQYVQAQKCKFKVKLENFDHQWNDIGFNKIVSYTNLDPGSYELKIIAGNADGVWNYQPVSIKINISPPFWQTLWFRLSVISLIILLFYVFYISRVKRIRIQKELLELQVRERTYEVIKQKETLEEQTQLLAQEKEKAELLLLNVLPEGVVDELKAKGKATARHYRLASIMFTDFCEFTRIAESLAPQDLVKELDSYFVKFDQIVEKYTIEKVKTIGDSYMAVGGIPVRNKSNPIDIVLAALEIQEFVNSQNIIRKKTGKPEWHLRIGIHTGELIAGVIGTKRFAYDVWGDSVNVASRMEATCEKGHINVSYDTYEVIKDFFVCEHRGRVEAKNKGKINMYYVHKIKPELSVDNKGISPSSLFYKYVNLHIYSSIKYRQAEQYIVELLENHLPSNLYYHDIKHTKYVVNAVEKLALLEGIEGDSIFLLKTAALFHDAGFVEQYKDNETIGANMAQKILPNFGYTKEQIDTIIELIAATKVPHNPENHLQEIICDADLFYLGGKSFHETADKLKAELLERKVLSSDLEWDKLQVNFFNSHRYFTASAINLRQKKKLQHLKTIEERMP